MNWVGALLGGLGLLIGVVLGLGIAALVRRGQHVDGLTVPQVQEIVVPAGIREVLKVIRSAGVVVGPHDEVLESTPHATFVEIPETGHFALNQKPGDIAAFVLEAAKSATTA